MDKERQILAIVAKQLGRSRESLRITDRLREDLQASKSDLMVIYRELEKTFSLVLPPFPGFNNEITLNDLAILLKVGKRQNEVINEAIRYAEDRDFAKAVDLFRAVLKVDPDNGEAWFNLGVTQANKGDFGQAIESYKRVLALTPSDSDAHYLMGMAYYDLGDRARGETCIKKAASLGKKEAAEQLDRDNRKVDMSWHDDVRRQREQLQEQRDLQDEASRKQSNLLRGFWNKLLEENSKLPSDLRLNAGKIQNVEFIGNRGGLFLDRSGSIIEYCLLFPQGNSVNIQRQPDYMRFFITCYEDRGIVAHGIQPHHVDPASVPLVDYELRDEHIQILLRNLCSNTDIWKGLKVKVKGCFIATAVYGSDDSKEVNALKSFRDNVLLSSCIGKSIVNMYYSFSPSLAQLLGNRDTLKRIIKFFILDPIVRVILKIGRV